MHNRCVFCGLDFGSEVRVCPRCREYKGVEEYTTEPPDAAALVASAGWTTINEAFEWFNDDRSHGDDYAAEAARELRDHATDGDAGLVAFVEQVLTHADAARKHDESQVARREAKFDAEIAAVESWGAVEALRGTIITTKERK